MTEQEYKNNVIYNVGDVIVYKRYEKGKYPPKKFIATSVDMDYGVVGYNCNGVKDTIGISYIRKANLIERIIFLFIN